MKRIKIHISGVVQGVGFRPFVFRLAKEMELNGYVLNTEKGVEIDAEGDDNTLKEFIHRVQNEKPAVSFINHFNFSFLQPEGHQGFHILQSRKTGEKMAAISPDLCICTDCAKELFDPGNRRFQYPFINCTHCGPRFSIITGIPYDRPNTSMKIFFMCSACQQEYDDPASRRFHAQPNACPECGPHVCLMNSTGKIIAQRMEAIKMLAELIRHGNIVAVKGIGGFHLMADARNDNAVNELRTRKRRPEKPFALMFPSLESVKKICEVSDVEKESLLSFASPIVLLEKKQSPDIFLAENIAPGNRCLGVMLPYSPLHMLLMSELNFPVVATSGNLSDEPICTDEEEVFIRLNEIADYFLVHDRPIVRPLDDSIIRIISGRPMVLRIARGYAPVSFEIKRPPGLAVGAQQKNSVALSTGKSVILGPHIGDLDTWRSRMAFRQAVSDLQVLYPVLPLEIKCDLHPDYVSGKYAHEQNISVSPVQHHYAHVLSCMADNRLQGTVLGIAFDGTGYGTDGRMWGSECLIASEYGFTRFAHLHYFPMPGGETAIRNPKRLALGLLFELLGDQIFNMGWLPVMDHFTKTELGILRKMLLKKINTPLTCSAGRLFDAIASLTGIRQQISFEGQAAMDLEFIVDKTVNSHYSFECNGKDPMCINWQPMVLEILEDIKCKISVGIIAAKFHHFLVEIIVDTALRSRQEKIVLSGGCFQNKYLAEKTIQRLGQEGLQVFWHKDIPPNDGGIALGQIMAVDKTGTGIELFQQQIKKGGNHVSRYSGESA